VKAAGAGKEVAMRRVLFAGVCVIAMAGCASRRPLQVREVAAATVTDEIQRIEVQRITVTTHSYWFDPNRIVVRRGVPVELTVRNAAFFVPHDFSCEAKEAGIDVDVRVGMFHAAKTVRFTPTKAGEYHFHCDVGTHDEKGMTGTLIVRG
jgi:plastocyanin